MKKQVVIIHGGEPYGSYRDFLRALKSEKPSRDDFKKGSHNHAKTWRDDVETKLQRTHEVFQPRMPNKDNSKYLEWKIWFEKILPFLRSGAIFVGHSLGGVFLAKYFAENRDVKKLKGLFLVAAPYGDGKPKYALADFALPSDLSKLKPLGSKAYLYFSKDDRVVPFGDLKKYRKIFPEAKVKVFTNRGHFKFDSFPEILEDIKSLRKRR